jgi:tRNA(fMet)-specific endonuclease VapC
LSFLLDTNICSAHLRRPGGLAHRFTQHGGQVAIPSIVLGELLVGAYHHASPERLLPGIEELLRETRVISFDELCARRFGELRGNLLKIGRPMNAVDAMIAAVALVHDLTLVTNNTKHFETLPNLRLEDWLSS